MQKAANKSLMVKRGMCRLFQGSCIPEARQDILNIPAEVITVPWFLRILCKKSKIFIDTYLRIVTGSLCPSPSPKPCHLRSMNRPSKWVFLQAELINPHLFLTHAQMLGHFQIFLVTITILFESDTLPEDDLWTSNFLHSDRRQ